MQEVTEDFKRGGWVVMLLGGIGMLARLLMTDQSSTKIVWLRKITAASLMGIIFYFALYDVPMAQIYKSVLLSLSGLCSPELLEFVITKVNQIKNREIPSKKK